ncbi:alpha/beta hydrolase [Streptomyces sp. GSL17-111]|uniref:alpha/beta hydrolase n=1 Tax=Streptomyces sp. GSL17-111 TaxID=3121596 RepID=UPI0030F4497C
MTAPTPGRSRRHVLASLAALGVLASAGPAGAAQVTTGTRPRRPRVVRVERAGERVIDLTLDSPALGGRGAVRLLTPRGWYRRHHLGAHWPTLYLLPGGDGDHLSWTEHHGIHRLADLRETLVVMPDMPLYGFSTDWWNHGAGGPPRVATYHLDEVMPLMERHFGAGRRRAVAGESQGGFGALSYSARRPGLFRAAASYSGYVHPLQHPHTVRAGMTYLGMDWLALWGHPVRQRAIWEAHDPVHLAHRLRGLPVHLSCGDGRLGPLDPPGTEPDPDIPGLEDPENPFPEDVYSPTEAIMREENETLAARLSRTGARLTTHFHPGTHDPAYWSREFRRSLPMLLAALHD